MVLTVDPASGAASFDLDLVVANTLGGGLSWSASGGLYSASKR